MISKYSQKYHQIQTLGRGAFGIAYLVKNKQNGTLVVAKKVFMDKMNKQERQKSSLQVEILRKLNSPFVVKYFESFIENKEMIIIMEYCEEGQLSNIIKKHKEKKEKISEDVIANWFVQLCLGLRHIHDNKIIHRDIKTNNIFLNSNKCIKIGDFGISKVLETISQSAHTFVGTPYYLSPEVCAEKPYGYKSDIWALGCVLYELCTLNFLFDAQSLIGLLLKIIKEQVPRIPKNYSQQLSEIVLRILSKQVNNRPTIDQIFSSAYIQRSMKEFLKRKGEMDINVSVKKTVLHQTLQSNIKSITSNNNNTINSQYISTQKQDRKINPRQELERRKQQKNAQQFAIMSNAAKTNASFKNTGYGGTRARVIEMGEINKTLASNTFKERNAKAMREFEEEDYERKTAGYIPRYNPNDDRQLPTTLKQHQLKNKVEEKKPMQKEPSENDDDLEQYNDQDFQQYHQEEQIRITQGATKKDLQQVQKLYQNQLKNKITQITSPLNKTQPMQPGLAFLHQIIQNRVSQLVSQLGKGEYQKLHDYVKENEERIDDDDDSFEREVKKRFPKVNRDQIEIVIEIIFREGLKKTKK